MPKVTKQAWLVSYDGGLPALFNYKPDESSSPCKVLAGPVDVTFDVPNACPHCGGALPEAAQAKAVSQSDSFANILGKEFIINVTHEQKGDKTYARVNRVVEAPTPNPKELVVEVGGTYKTRNGRVATIEKYLGSIFSYSMRGRIGNEEMSWTATGAWCVGDESPQDLVERIA